MHRKLSTQFDILTTVHLVPVASSQKFIRPPKAGFASMGYQLRERLPYGTFQQETTNLFNLKEFSFSEQSVLWILENPYELMFMVI